jgi:alpha-beta hydrolase superfamily lysophospholipase
MAAGASDDTAEIPVIVAPIVAQSVVPPPATHAAPRRRRRWPWITLAAVVIVLVAVSVGTLWYVSGLIGEGVRVAQPDDGFPLLLTAADDSSITYSGPTGTWHDQGLMGMATVEGGYVETESPTTTGGLTTRSVVAQILPPSPAAGQPAALDGWYFPRNPKVGLGLDFEDVMYDAPLGPTPAWLIPGAAKTWVIYSHGRGSGPGEGLRIANTVAELGYPMLLIKYRDDNGAPYEDGRGGFGAQEWPDLEAAVQYAVDRGAQHVVLAGSSMGASISLAFLENSALAGVVVGSFLDSPITDFSQVIDLQAQDRGIPGFLTAAAKGVAAVRYGFDYDATDYTARASALTTPVLIVQGTADTTVPPAVAADFAAAAGGDKVQLELFAGAGHLLSWNVDRARYVGLLTDFLARVAPVS